MNKPAIKIARLSKRYRIGSRARGYKTFREAVMDTFLTPWRGLGLSRVRERDFWALKDISFEVHAGEVIGIIGRNGAGKSTLLKILSRITQPTEGYAEIYGRVGSLLEVGTGFHPELTGRENIYLNGAILGMRRSEIKGKFDEIVAFSEVEKFIDTPVKRYSSGMYMRLAFAVAAHLAPEILIVDEVLAVGDAGFQKKCLGKMGEVAKDGRTVLFVSHSMAAIQSLCGRVMLLQEGRLARAGGTQEVIREYLQQNHSQVGCRLIDRQDREGTGEILLTDLRINGLSKGSVMVCSGDEVQFDIEYERKESMGSPVFHIGLYDMFGLQIIHCCSSAVKMDIRDFGSRGRVECVIGRLPLPPGVYRVNIAVMNGAVTYDYIKAAADLEVEESNYYGEDSEAMKWAKCLVKHRWAQYSPEGLVEERDVTV